MTLSREAVGRSEQQEKHQDTKVTKQTLDSFVSFVLFVFFPQPTRLMTGVKRARASIEVIANRPKNRTEKWPAGAEFSNFLGAVGHAFLPIADLWQARMPAPRTALERPQ